MTVRSHALLGEHVVTARQFSEQIVAVTQALGDEL